MDLALDDGLEVGLHLRAADLDERGERHLAALGADVVADDGELMVLDLRRVAGDDELAGRVLGVPELNVGVGLADYLALEGGGEADRDGDLADLYLDVAQLERGLDGLGVVGDADQRAGDLILAEVHVDDDGEAERDRAGAGGYDDLVERAEGVDEGGDALLGVVEELTEVARRDGAEDERRADGDGDDVDDGGYVVAQRHDAVVETHLDALGGGLIDDVADEEGQQALVLVVLDDGGELGGLLRAAENDGDAGDVARDEGHAEAADDGIGHEADAALALVGILVEPLQTLDDLRSDGGRETGVESLAEVLLVGDEALEDADAGGQVAELGDLDAGRGVDGGEEVGGVGESDAGILAVLGDGVVDGALGKTRDGVGAGVDEIGKNAHVFSS